MRKILRRLLYTSIFCAAALAVLIVVLVARTLNFHSRQVNPPSLAGIEVDEAGAVERLAGALAIETVSRAPGRGGVDTFSRLHEYLKAAFPRARKALTWETVGGQSLLLTWPGSDAARKPLLLLAHLDVVPADSKAGWSHRPSVREEQVDDCVHAGAAGASSTTRRARSGFWRPSKVGCATASRRGGRC